MRRTTRPDVALTWKMATCDAEDASRLFTGTFAGSSPGSTRPHRPACQPTMGATSLGSRQPRMLVSPWVIPLGGTCCFCPPMILTGQPVACRRRTGHRHLTAGLDCIFLLQVQAICRTPVLAVGPRSGRGGIKGTTAPSSASFLPRP